MLIACETVFANRERPIVTRWYSPVHQFTSSPVHPSTGLKLHCIYIPNDVCGRQLQPSRRMPHGSKRVRTYAEPGRLDSTRLKVPQYTHTWFNTCRQQAGNIIKIILLIYLGRSGMCHNKAPSSQGCWNDADWQTGPFRLARLSMGWTDLQESNTQSRLNVALSTMQNILKCGEAHTVSPPPFRRNN